MRRWLLAGLLVTGAACGGAGGGTESGAPASTTPVPRVPTVAGSGCWSAVAPIAAGPERFADSTEELGLVEPLRGLRGHAVAAGDVNRDGWTDLFVAGFADRPLKFYEVRGADGPAPDQLLFGSSDGFIVDTEFEGELARTTGAMFADLDGDGDADLVVARNVDDRDRARAGTSVYRNDDGRLTLDHVLDDEMHARAIGALDHDHDGDLDLYLVDDLGQRARGSSRLFENVGGLDFEDATEEAGLPDDVIGLGLGVGDLTLDGWTDLVVGGSNRVFVGGADGFAEAALPVLEWETFGEEDAVAGVAIGDINRDGRPDVVLGQHYGSTVDQGRRVPVRLYLNEGVDDRGRPTLRDVTDEAGIPGFVTKAPHVDLADLDNDGWLDLVVSASADRGEQPVVLHNVGPDGDGVPELEAPPGLTSTQYWVTGATSDFDHDGRLDLFLVEFDVGKPSRAFENQLAAGHWLAVDASALPLGGVGTIVEMYEAGGVDDTDALLAREEVSLAAGFAAGDEPVVRLGLGERTEVDLLIRPASGPALEMSRVAADRLIRPPDC